MSQANPQELIDELAERTSRLKDDWEIFQKDYGKRRPIVIEFSGTPKSGKSTTLKALIKFLEASGLVVRLVIERASICPLEDKEHFSFNAWTGCQSLIGFLEGIYPCDFSDVNSDPDPDVVILDRGLFDVLVWIEWLQSNGKMLDEEADAFSHFFTLPAFANMTDLVLSFSTNAAVALRREALVTMRTKVGRIMNESTLLQFNEAAERAKLKHSGSFPRIEFIDTTDLNLEETVLETLDKVTEMLEYIISEKVLCLNMESFKALNVKEGLSLDPALITSVLETIGNNREFIPRRNAETDFELIQPIVCLVLRRDEKVFLLRRSEPDKTHRLHEQFVVWAGGHVREEDNLSDIAETLKQALMREIDEELRVRSKFEPQLIGVVYDTSRLKSTIHFGLVYEAHIESPDVALAISQREFKERRGTSLSGVFVEITDDKLADLDLEPWSAHIINHLGGKTAVPGQESLRM